MTEQVNRSVDTSMEFLKSQTCPPDVEVGADRITHLQGTRLVYRYLNEQGSVAIARMNGVLGVEPQLESTVRSNKMLQTFFSLLGTNTLEHIIC